jgi:8-oxo-dGTP pyrophosphatase MutT (NUDIX family)
VAAAADRVALRRLIEERLRDTRPPTPSAAGIPAGFTPEAYEAVRQYYPAAPTPAAVLIPIVDHEDGLTVLLTQRASHLKNHAGQISFPGGRIEAADDGPLAAALRETEEEIGLGREHVTFAGYLDPHLVLTGFWVTPVVAFVQPGFELRLDCREVETTFEVPLAHILDARNHHSRERLIGGGTSVRVYDIPYGPHHIWGATAGMLVSLYRMVNH